MSIRMIVTDLDKTLLRNDGTVSERTVNVFNDCRARGIFIAYATARSERSCGRIIKTFEPDAIVSNAGALVRIGTETVYRAVIGAETAGGLLRSCASHRSVGYITADTDEGYFIDRPVDPDDPNWVEYQPAIPTDFSRWPALEAYKITVEFFNREAPYSIASPFPAVEVIPFAGENWFRFADRAAGKWNGVRALASRTGIAVSETAAFGDDIGDIEMLQNCGFGVAVRNAYSDVKSSADIICASNEADGVAAWLEERVLS